MTYVQEELRELLNEKELQLTAVQRAHGQLEAELAAATHAAAGGRGVQDDDTATERQLTVAARVEELNSRIGELRSVVAKREASAKKHKEHVRPATFLSPLYISHTLFHREPLLCTSRDAWRLRPRSPPKHQGILKCLAPHARYGTELGMAGASG